MATKHIFASTFQFQRLWLFLGLLCLWRKLHHYYRLGFRQVKRGWMQYWYRYLQHFSYVKTRLRKEQKALRLSLEDKLKDPQRPRIQYLPSEGHSPDSIKRYVESNFYKESDLWKKGGCSGCVYHGDEAHLLLLSQVYHSYSVANPLHPEVWPSIRDMEAQIISMTGHLMGLGGEADKVKEIQHSSNSTPRHDNSDALEHDICGAITSGGTESIILALKAYRGWGIDHKGLYQSQEVIIPETAHAAFDKACELLQMIPIKIPVDPLTQKVRTRDVKLAITHRTVAIIASAPNFHSGTIDPITELAELALTRGVGLHVDCCLGAFFLPFMRDLGYPVVDYDFQVKGVTSMSCDTHKYGYAPKGTSVVLFNEPKLRHYMYFCYPDWTGGLYCTPTIAGSRSGAVSAACWASLMHVGRTGFQQITRDILETRDYIAESIKTMDGIELLTEPETMILTMISKTYNIYEVGDKLQKKGWHLNQLQNPAAIHLCLTRLHTQNETAESFLKDLVLVIQTMASSESSCETGSASVYGMAGSLPDGPVSDLLKTYLDVTLGV